MYWLSITLFVIPWKVWREGWPPVFWVHFLPVSLGIHVCPGWELLHPDKMGVIEELRDWSLHFSDAQYGILAVTLLAYMHKEWEDSQPQFCIRWSWGEKSMLNISPNCINGKTSLLFLIISVTSLIGATPILPTNFGPRSSWTWTFMLMSVAPLSCKPFESDLGITL